MGFQWNFFKAFHAKLILLLHSVSVESLSLGSLHPPLRQASIIVLLKDKDPALARRLERVLPTIISKEQTGFIKGCQLYYNVCTLLNVIYSKETTVTPEVVISMCQYHH